MHTVRQKELEYIIFKQSNPDSDVFLLHVDPSLC